MFGASTDACFEAPPRTVTSSMHSGLDVVLELLGLPDALDVLVDAGITASRPSPIQATHGALPMMLVGGLYTSVRSSLFYFLLPIQHILLHRLRCTRGWHMLVLLSPRSL